MSLAWSLFKNIVLLCSNYTATLLTIRTLNCPSSNLKNIFPPLQILSDEERRYNYDNYGTTSEQKPNSHQQQHGFRSPFGFYSDMPFSHSFFSNTGHKNIQILTNRLYENTVLSVSRRIPQLIYVYGDWCFQCKFSLQWRMSQKYFIDIWMTQLSIKSGKIDSF